jgi:magnesium-protoporphyrin O-methyltransferase
MKASSCCSLTDGIEQQFDTSKVHKELAAYQDTGPGPTTRGLLAELQALGTPPATVLDIGSGIGALSLGMLQAGAGKALCVEISMASLTASAEEAKRQGFADRMEFRAGDFVAIAPTLPVADLVTLDRVVCCYPRYAPLLEEAAAHSRRLLALSYPRNRWWIRAALWVENTWRRLRGNSFRTFLHSPEAMSALLQRCGWIPTRRSCTWTWQIEIFSRNTT